MAKAKEGLFGNLSGKIGNVVVSSWKGIPYIRSKPARSTSNTKAQQNQRGKFGLVITFVNKIKPVINAGFKWNTDRMTELNSATSWLMKRAVRGEHPDLSLDYPSVLVARGDLPGPRDAEAELDVGKLVFRWIHSAGTSRDDDRVLALAWCPEAEQGVWKVDDGTRRKDGSVELELPDDWRGNRMECWLAFTSSDGQEASDSVYLGSLSYM